MFVKKLSQVTEQLSIDKSNSCIQNYLVHGIQLWCVQLSIEKNITNYILNNYCQWSAIQDITTYFWNEWQPKEKEEKNFIGQIVGVSFLQNRLNYLVSKVLNQVNIKSENMKFIALVSFIIAAVGYWLYVINQPTRRQSSPKETLNNYSTNHPTYPIQKQNKQFLVLVIAAEKVDLVCSMKTKGYLSPKDGEKLYELTKYLWVGSESDFTRKESNTKNYLVSENKESEFDNYLVYLELKQSDEGLKPNVGQLARYDAFCNLANLTVNFDISPRLQMEAYSNFELYSR